MNLNPNRYHKDARWLAVWSDKDQALSAA